MARRHRDDETEESAGQDSFLDLVANIVGILILLVVIVGIRAATVVTSKPQTMAETSPLVTAEAVRGVEVEVAKTFAEMAELRHKAARAEFEATELDSQRVALIEYVAAAEKHLQERRLELTGRQRNELDINVELVQAEKKLEDLARKQLSLLSERPASTTLRNVPTPIVKKVTSKEVTVWVSDGQVSIIPSDELDELVISDIQRRRHLPTDISRVGPLNGFQLHYAILSRRITTPGGVVESRGIAGEYRPVPGQKGDSIEEACSSESKFVMHLNRFDPKTTAVTFWTSANSFAEIGPLRELAAKRGFSTAIRPLPEGRYVGFAPGGSDTRAQ